MHALTSHVEVSCVCRASNGFPLKPVIQPPMSSYMSSKLCLSSKLCAVQTLNERTLATHTQATVSATSPER